MHKFLSVSYCRETLFHKGWPMQLCQPTVKSFNTTQFKMKKFLWSHYRIPEQNTSQRLPKTENEYKSHVCDLSALLDRVIGKELKLKLG